MPRYIDAEGLNLYDDLFMKGKNDSGVWVRYRDVERLIRNAPTADVEEVKHGKWVFNRDGYICCSKCSCQPYRESRTIDFDNLWERCPNCGAKMDEKESGE